MTIKKFLLSNFLQFNYFIQKHKVDENDNKKILAHKNNLRKQLPELNSFLDQSVNKLEENIKLNASMSYDVIVNTEAIGILASKYIVDFYYNENNHIKLSYKQLQVMYNYLYNGGVMYYSNLID